MPACLHISGKYQETDLPATKTNPLFSRAEKRRARKHVRGAMRKGLSKIFGIPLSRGLSSQTPPSAKTSRRSAHRTAKPSSGPYQSTAVRSDVIEALKGQGYNAGTAKKMAEGVRADDTFESAFRRVISRNPAELIIFGNPSKVYSLKQVSSMRRSGNPIPAALLTAFESAAGSKLFDSVTSKSKNSRSGNFFGLGRKGATRETVESRRDAEAHARLDAGDFRGAKRVKKQSAKKFAREQGIKMEGGLQRVKRRVRRKLQKKASRAIGRLFNPDAETRATQLFEKFHHRDASGVFERQRSARQRKDYTILGPLVAIGINPEYFDKMEARAGAKQFADWSVEHYDQLPRLDFMTPGQVSQVKNMLGDPGKYVKDCPLLASSPNGRQLYALAEDVQLDLGKFDTDAQKDYVDLGDATFVVYMAKKPHEVREFVHMLGEHGGTRPRLMYDRLRKEVCFIGGSYVVKAPGIMH